MTIKKITGESNDSFEISETVVTKTFTIDNLDREIAGIDSQIESLNTEKAKLTKLKTDSLKL